MFGSEPNTSALLCLSQHDNAQLLPRALEAGVDACVDKITLSTELLTTIHRVRGNTQALEIETAGQADDTSLFDIANL